MSKLVCLLCSNDLIKKNDRNLVDGSGVFKPKDELNDLDLVVSLNDPEVKYVCRNCTELLKKRKNLRESLDKVNQALLSVYQKTSANVGRGIKWRNERAKRSLFSMCPKQDANVGKRPKHNDCNVKPSPSQRQESSGLGTTCVEVSAEFSLCQEDKSEQATFKDTLEPISDLASTSFCSLLNLSSTLFPTAMHQSTPKLQRVFSINQGQITEQTFSPTPTPSKTTASPEDKVSSGNNNLILVQSSNSSNVTPVPTDPSSKHDHRISLIPAKVSRATQTTNIGIPVQERTLVLEVQQYVSG